jgi:hypothetical protein
VAAKSCRAPAARPSRAGAFAEALPLSSDQDGILLVCERLFDSNQREGLAVKRHVAYDDAVSAIEEIDEMLASA